jgi:hypothetical protein
MPDEPSIPAQLRALAGEPLPTSSEARRLMRAAAKELEERAGRLCELRAELAAAQRWKTAGETWHRVAESRGDELAHARRELAAARREIERLRNLATSAWGSTDAAMIAEAIEPDPADRERLLDAMAAAYSSCATVVLGPGVQIAPRRRAVLIRASYDHLAAPGSIVRCGRAGALWTLQEITFHGMPDSRVIFRVELEPVDAHAVQMDAAVHEIPVPLSDLGWVPDETPPAPAATP